MTERSHNKLGLQHEVFENSILPILRTLKCISELYDSEVFIFIVSAVEMCLILLQYGNEERNKIIAFCFAS